MGNEVNAVDVSKEGLNRNIKAPEKVVSENRDTVSQVLAGSQKNTDASATRIANDSKNIGNALTSHPNANKTEDSLDEEWEKFVKIIEKLEKASKEEKKAEEKPVEKVEDNSEESYARFWEIMAKLEKASKEEKKAEGKPVEKVEDNSEESYARFRKIIEKLKK